MEGLREFLITAGLTLFGIGLLIGYGVGIGLTSTLF